MAGVPLAAPAAPARHLQLREGWGSAGQLHHHQHQQQTKTREENFKKKQNKKTFSLFFFPFQHFPQLLLFFLFPSTSTSPKTYKESALSDQSIIQINQWDSFFSVCFFFSVDREPERRKSKKQEGETRSHRFPILFWFRLPNNVYTVNYSLLPLFNVYFVLGFGAGELGFH